MPYPWLLPMGIVLGAFGTLIGAGGGFLLVPALILLYPNEQPETITSISLAVVCLNALSGSAAYARMRRIDYRSGIWFAAATLPGAILGALLTTVLSRTSFDASLGIVLTLIALMLLLPESFTARFRRAASEATTDTLRVIVDRDGSEHRYGYKRGTGVALSALVGFLSSVLGIGGGVLHVPGLVYLLHFPPHIAAATSHFVLVFMASAATVVHIATGTFAHGIRRTAWLGAGVLIGAQLGARLSRRVRDHWILRALAVGLALVGIRILIEAFRSD